MTNAPGVNTLLGKAVEFCLHPLDLTPFIGRIVRATGNGWVTVRIHVKWSYVFLDLVTHTTRIMNLEE